MCLNVLLETGHYSSNGLMHRIVGCDGLISDGSGSPFDNELGLYFYIILAVSPDLVR